MAETLGKQSSALALRLGHERSPLSPEVPPPRPTPQPCSMGLPHARPGAEQQCCVAMHCREQRCAELGCCCCRGCEVQVGAVHRVKVLQRFYFHNCNLLRCSHLSCVQASALCTHCFWRSSERRPLHAAAAP